MIRSLLQLLAITFLAAPSLLAVPDIRFQGRQSGVWNDIDDGDNTPDQTVTQFGNIDIGESADRLYRLRNTGNEPLTVQSFASSSRQFTAVGLSLPITIAAGGERQFDIRYTPTSAGERSTLITFRSNDPDAEDPYTFVLNGTGLAGEISVYHDPPTGGDVIINDGDTSPRTADCTNFGSRRVGDGPDDHDFYIRNSSTADAQLTIVNPRITGTGASHFEIRSLGTSKLGIGNNRNFKIRFDPTSAGVHNATFIVDSNDPDESPYSFAITGTGTAESEIRVRGTRPGEPLVEISNGDNSPRQAIGTLFADTDVGSDRTSNFRIHNDGDGPLTLGTPSVNDSHFQVLNFSTASIAAGSSRDFNIRFRPTSSGLKIGTFSFANNDSNENPFLFTVRGLAEAPEMDLLGSADGNVFNPIADGSNRAEENTGTEFGSTPVGNPVAHQFSIINNGNTPLNITGRSFEGNGASSFDVSGLLAGNPFVKIGVGETQIFTITFDPSTAGEKNAVISIENTDPDENPYTFALRGIGVSDPNIRIRGRQSNVFNDISDGDTNPNDQTVTQFADTDLGDTDTRVYRVVNDGPGTLNLTSFASSDPQFTFSGTPNTIAANTNNSDGNFEIDFTPTSRGSHTATITILSNDPDSESTYTFQVTGTGQGAEISVAGSGTNTTFTEITDGDNSPRELDGTLFPDRSFDIDSAAQRTFRITNSGDRNLNISGRSFTGSGASHFKVNGLLAGNPFVNINPGESQDFTMTFDPSNAGVKTATFNIESNDGSTPTYNFLIQGVSIAEPNLHLHGRRGNGGWKRVWKVVEPERENGTSFESADINGGSSTRTFRIRNEGTATLNITSIVSSRPEFTPGTVPGPIAPGDSDTFTVSFAPNLEAGFPGVITINSNDRNDPWDFNVTGWGTDNSGPDIKVLGRSSIVQSYSQVNTIPDTSSGNDFGTRSVDGQSRTRTFRIENNGGSTLIIDSITINSPHFTLGAIPSTIAPGDRDTLDITFNPTSPGRHVAEFVIVSNDSDDPSRAYNILGNGDTEPDGAEVAVSGNTFIIESGDNTPSLIDGTQFGIATGNPARRFFINNFGNQDLTVTNLASSETYFTAALVNGSGTIPAGTSRWLDITYTNAQDGLFAATITFDCNDSDEPTYSFSVNARNNSTRPELDISGTDGVAIPDGTTTPLVTAGCDFGSVDIASDGQQRRFTLTNSGNFDLTIAAAQVDSTQFEIQSYPAIIPPGESGTLNVLFAPDTAGVHDATITIFSDDFDENAYDFAITGTGTGEEDETRTSAISAIVSGYTFSFPAQRFQTYRIMQSTDLKTWTTVPGQTDIEGNGSIIFRTLTDLQDPGGRVYLRAELETEN